MTKIWVGRTTLNEEKKRMTLRQKRHPTFYPDVKHVPVVSPGHNIVASFILEIIPPQVSSEAMTGDYRCYGAFSLTRPLE